MTRRPLIVGISSLVFAAALLGCGSSSPKDSSDWSYNPPEGFKQQDKEKNGATVFLGPRDDGFQSNLLVKAGTNSKDNAKKIGEDTLARFKSDSSVTVKEQEPYTVPDSDAYTWLISKKLPSGVAASQRQFLVMKNGIVVEFTMTASDKEFTKYDQALADSLQSFKWGR